MARKLYRFLTGKDDAAFCQRVSDALADGYRLHGDPCMVVRDGEVIVGQAIVLADAPTAREGRPPSPPPNDFEPG